MQPTDLSLSTSSTTKDYSLFNKNFTINNQKGRFKLISNKDKTSYEAFIKLHAHDNYHSVPIDWKGISADQLLKASPFEIQMVVKAKENRFEISRILPKPQLNGSLSDQAASTQKQVSNVNFILINNVWEFVAAVKKVGEPQGKLVEKLIDKMITHFDRESIHLKSNNREMIGLLPIMTQEQRYAHVSRFIDAIDVSFLQDKGALETLKEILYSYQQENFMQLAKKSTLGVENKELCLPPLDEVLDAEQLLKVANLLKEKTLDESKAGSTNPEGSNEPLWSLEAFIAVLVAMPTNKIDKEKNYQPFYEVLDEFDLRAELKEAYLAALGKQFLVHIPADEMERHALMRHSYQVIQGCLNLYKAYSNKSLGLIGDAAQNFEEAAKIQQFEADWYITLFSIEYAIAIHGGKYFNCLKELIEIYDHLGYQDAKKVLSSMHTHHPFFLMGFARQLKEFLDYGAADLGTCETVIWLLERICMDNINQKGIFHVSMKAYTTVKRFISHDVRDLIDTGQVEERNKSYSQQIVPEILNDLLFYAISHATAGIRVLAQASAEAVHKKLNPSQGFVIPAFRPEHFPNTFFLKNANKVAPYRLALQQKCMRLEEDPQLKKESLYYVNVKVESAWGKLAIHDALYKFLESDYTSMLVTGTSGTGKTFTMKQFAKQLWQQGNLCGFIPIFISLSTVNDPCSAIRDILSELSPSIKIADLQREKDIKFLFILDEVDETATGAKVNLYSKNALNLWKGSKVIFTCRSERYDPEDAKAFYHGETDKKNFTEIKTLPFEDTQTREYLNKFLEHLGDQGRHSNWTVERYMKYIDRNESLKKLISVPLHLYFIAETLPGIVESCQNKEGPLDDQTIENNLLGGFFCLIIERELYKKFGDKSTSLDAKELEKYLKYALNAAKTIHDYELKHKDEPDKKGPWIPLQEAKKAHPELFNFAKEEVCSVSRCCSICIRNKKVGFVHEAFYSFFLRMTANNLEKGMLKERLLSRKYGFDQMLSGSKTFY